LVISSVLVFFAPGRLLLEIVVRLGPLARAEFVAVLPVGDVVFHGARAGVDRVVHLRLGARRISPLLIGQDQGVFAFFVLEEVEDALLLH
jgi:hypothetical protein